MSDPARAQPPWLSCAGMVTKVPRMAGHGSSYHTYFIFLALYPAVQNDLAPQIPNGDSLK